MTTPDTRPETRAELKALCHSCGAPAACIGRYEMMTESEYACDDCCGHGNEDGWCWLMSDIPDEVDALLAQPTQPDAVEALTYTIVEWGDLGPMCFTSQDANRVTLAEAKEALERILSNNPYNRRFTICAVHPVPSALTTDEEGA